MFELKITEVYWKPVYYALEDRFAVWLCNARHVKQVPGRKTDITDAQWLCQLMEAGLLRGSFVPPKPQRQLRTLTRYRKTLIQERADEVNRVQKVLEMANLKLASVATNVLGKSGRDMLTAIIGEQDDPEHGDDAADAGRDAQLLLPVWYRAARKVSGERLVAEERRQAAVEDLDDVRFSDAAPQLVYEGGRRRRRWWCR